MELGTIVSAKRCNSNHINVDGVGANTVGPVYETGPPHPIAGTVKMF